MKTLESKISSYAEALAALPSEKTGNYETQVLSILIARDGVAHELKRFNSIDEHEYGRLVAADKRLKRAAKAVVDAAGGEAFINWRAANQPPDSAWWWFLDKRVAEDEKEDKEAKRKRDSLWIILTVLCVSVSIPLMAEIIKRLFSGGVDGQSIFNTILQALITVVNACLGVLALGSLVDPGWQWAERLFTDFGLFKEYGAKKRLFIAAVVLIAVLGLRLSLPAIARFYVERGKQAAIRNDQSAAVEILQRAASLDPGNAYTHYALGNLYEDQHRYDEAINEYSLATALDSRNPDAQNNLAQLYIWRGKDRSDFTKALQIIDDTLTSLDTKSDWSVRYALYKNRGWANYELQNYSEAEKDLRRAIELDLHRPGRKDESNDRAAPHCLLGKVYEAQHRKEAETEWDFCARYQCNEVGLKAEWTATARERTGFEDCTR